MPSNTTYDPSNENYLDKTKIIKDARGVAASITLGGITNLDLAITDDMLLTGGFVLVKYASQGDTVDFQVLSGATVLKQFFTSWYLDSSKVAQDTPSSFFPAKIFAGLTLRVVYHATGPTGLLSLLSSPLWLAVNYDLQKVLE